MNKNFQALRLVGIIPLFIFLFLVGLTSCNSINNAVEDALKTTEFKLTALDELAADVLSDSTIIHSIYKNKTAAYLDTTGGKYNITYPSGTKDTLDLTAYPDVIDALNANQVTLTVLDTAYRVTTGTPKISGFAFNPQTYGKVVFYITDYVNLQVEDREGNIVAPKSQAIPFELSSTCYSINPTSKKPEPKIKTRVEYELTNSTYLVKIIRTDQTLSRIFYVAVLGE